MQPTPEAIAYFWSQVVQSPEPDGCWLWTTPRHDGYGQLYLRGTRMTAHAFSWLYHHGYLNTAQCLRHTCDVRACVNPDHLEPGTYKQNMEDMLRRNPRFQVPDATVQAIRAAWDAGERLADIAARFDMKPTRTRSIAIRATFTWVPELSAAPCYGRARGRPRRAA